MKKIMVGVILLIVLFFILTYIFIPSILNVSTIVYCKSTSPGAYRTFVSKGSWQKWFSNKVDTSAQTFAYNNNTYSLSDVYLNGGAITIKNNNDSIKSEIRIMELVYDSIVVDWKFSIQTSKNPFERIKQYQKCVSLKNDMQHILNSYKNFVEKDENVYGIPIRTSSITHIFLITTRKEFDHYPSTKEIYDVIDYLEEFATKQNLKQTYYPMMNVTKNNAATYRLMIGLPVDKETNFNNNIHSVRMVQGNFITTEVRGGQKTVDNALNQIQFYFQDYEKTAMAIPFAYLVTNRLNEPDTIKWITKIYAPVQ